MVSALRNEISAPSAPWVYCGKAAVNEEVGLQPGIESDSTLILDFCSPKLYEINLCKKLQIKPPSLWHFDIPVQMDKDKQHIAVHLIIQNSRCGICRSESLMTWCESHSLWATMSALKLSTALFPGLCSFFCMAWPSQPLLLGWADNCS